MLESAPGTVRSDPPPPEPVRVLMTLDAVGGVWRYSIDLGAALMAAGLDVVFVGLGPGPSPAQRAEADAVGRLVWLDAPLDWMAERESDLDRLPDQLAELVERFGADLLHLNVPSQAFGLDVACPVVVASHSCVVTWFRTVRGEDVLPHWAWQKHRNRGGFDRADWVLAPSRSHAELMQACYGPIDNLRVVFNAVRPQGGHRPKRDVVLAAARWWDEGKNGRVLDEAAGMMAAPLVLAGRTVGPSGQTLSFTHASEAGELLSAEVRRLMGEAAVFVSPSIYEPFGLATVEAASAEAALVLSDIPTYRELWDGAALFARPDDPAAFAAAVNRLIADRDLRDAMGRLAAERSTRFSPEAQARSVLDIYAAAGLRRPLAFTEAE